MAKEPRAKLRKSNHMRDEDFANLKVAFEDALAHERGERKDMHVTRVAVPHPPKPMSTSEIIQVRRRLNCSQAIFAMMLNISPRTVQAWEQGVRKPSDAALKLLNIAKTHPEVLLEKG
jgi:putative transcriptional regulator